MSRRATKPTEDIVRIADKYAREQLANMDGTTEAGIRRIGTERFDELVRKLSKDLQKLRNAR